MKRDKTRISSFLMKKFFPVRVVKHSNRLSREAVEAPSLESLKLRLDGVLKNLI